MGAITPGGSANVQVEPGGFLDEFPEEEGPCDGAAIAVSYIFQVRHLGFELLPLHLAQGQAPYFFSGLLGCFFHMGQEGFVIAEESSGGAPEGNHTGAGEGGQVNNGLGVVFCGQTEQVPQDKAAFRVGIADFNGFPHTGGEDVRRAIGLMGGHVFAGPQQGDDGEGGA